MLPNTPVYFLQQSQKQPVFQGASAPVLENSLVSEHLGTCYACCYLGVITSRASHLREEGNVYVWYIYIFLYIATVSIYYTKYESILMAPILMHCYTD